MLQKYKTFLRREILKEIARTTDKNAIKDLLLKEIPELHHSSLIGKVDSIAEKLVQADKPFLVRKTLQQEFDNIAKEMGVDLAKVRKEVAQGFLGKPSKISRSFFDISDISSPETSEVFNFVGRQVNDLYLKFLRREIFPKS